MMPIGYMDHHGESDHVHYPQLNTFERDAPTSSWWTERIIYHPGSNGCTIVAWLSGKFWQVNDGTNGQQMERSIACSMNNARVNALLKMHELVPASNKIKFALESALEKEGG